MLKYYERNYYSIKYLIVDFSNIKAHVFIILELRHQLYGEKIGMLVEHYHLPVKPFSPIMHVQLIVM